MSKVLSIRVAAAMAGLATALVIFGSGLYIGAAGSSPEPAFPDYVVARDPDQGGHVSRELDGAVSPHALVRQPCNKPVGTMESELCAQWRSTMAAEQSAWWEKISVWAGLFGVAGLATTLWFNFEAWRQARESRQDTERSLYFAQRSAEAMDQAATGMRSVASYTRAGNEASQQFAQARLRAYLGTLGAAAFDALSTPALTIDIKNFGATPAFDLKYVAHVSLFRKPGSGLAERTDWFNCGGNIGLCEPGHTQNLTTIIDQPIDRVFTARVIYEATLTFRDVFGSQRWRRITYEIGPFSRVREGKLVMDVPGLGNTEGEGDPPPSALT